MDGDVEDRVWFKPLPSPPTFPVYGLSRSFTGLRAMSLWNLPTPRPLWEVELHHGHAPLSQGPSVVVITAAKLPAQPTQPATGIVDAAGKALLHLLHAEAEPDFSPAAVRALVDLAEDLEGPAWEGATATVDAASREVRQHRRGGLWVAAADLGPVAIAVVGHGVDLDDVQLEPVNDVLDDYLTS